ncbi:hypothetical protein ACFY5A_07865 [Microbacterium sp. NPDC012755]
MSLHWCTRRTGYSTLSKTVGGAVVIAAMLTLAACAPAETDGASPSPSPSATQILPPGATESPDAGDGPQTAAPLPTQEAAVGETVAFDTGISVVIDKVESVTVKAETPGEVSGTAVVVTVTAKNGTDAAQSLDSAVVTVNAQDGEPGIGTTAGDPAPLTGSLAPGKSATGRYVFMLGSASGRDVAVSVNYAAGEPVAIFTGKVS